MAVSIKRHSANSEPNVVPLCDILLVLLIIFMVISPMAQSGIDVVLPENIEDGGGRGIVLTVKADGTYSLNMDIFNSLDSLKGRLIEIYSTRSTKAIFFRACETLPYHEVIKVIDMLKAVGVDTIGTMTYRYNE